MATSSHKQGGESRAASMVAEGDLSSSPHAFQLAIGITTIEASACISITSM
jgi:hypothetical protein